MKRNVWVFGGLSGLVIAMMMIISTSLCYGSPDFEGSMVLGYAGMLIAFSFIFIGVKNFRDKQQGGAITFGSAFRMGLLITLIASTVYVAVWLVEYYMFMPDFMERYADHVMRQAQKSGKSAAALDQQAKEMAQYKEWYKNPAMVVLLTYMEVLPVGLVVSLICALILKRKSEKPVLTA